MKTIQQTYPVSVRSINVYLIALVALFLAGCLTPASVQLKPVDNPNITFSKKIEKSRAATEYKVIYRTQPAYPFELRRAGVTGEAVIWFIVNERGEVEEPQARTATDIRFAEAALRAVSLWRFEPARDAEGKPVAQVAVVPIEFTLNG